jgi:hypothetical protein
MSLVLIRCALCDKKYMGPDGEAQAMCRQTGWLLFVGPHSLSYCKRCSEKVQ